MAPWSGDAPFRVNFRFWHFSDMRGQADAVSSWGQSRPRGYERRLPTLTQTGHSGLHGAACHRTQKPLFATAGFPIRPHNLAGNRRVNGRHHVCAAIWGGISAVRYSRPSGRNRLSRVDGLCLVSLERDALLTHVRHRPGRPPYRSRPYYRAGTLSKKI